MIGTGWSTVNKYSEQENFNGNGKHLKVLLSAIEKKQIQIWNDFAKAQGSGFIADLTGVKVEGAPLAGINLAGAKLGQANFDGCDLTGADLTGAQLKGATFRGAELKNAKIKVAPKIKAVRKGAVEVQPDGKTIEREFPEEAYNDPALLRKLRFQKMQEQALAHLEKRKADDAEKQLIEEKKQLKSRGAFLMADDDQD